jgi:hypothetical protein
MRKARIITIEGLGEVTVKEISPLAAYKAMDATDKIGEVMAIARDCVVMPSGKELQDLYPSEIEQIVDVFLEVNSSFFAIAEKLGIKGILESIKTEAGTILQQLFAESYREVMAGMPGTTAGVAL